MDFGIYAGDTNKTIYLRLRDSTTGLAKTGLVYNSAGAVASYTLPLAARAAITLATQTVTGAHSDGGFVEVDATNCKGLYRFDLSDAAIASGDYTVISIEFDGIIEESILIPLHTRQVNVTEWLGTAAATPTVAGVPEVDLTHVAGATTNVSALATNVDAIKTKTDFLPSATAGAAGGVFIAGTNAATTITTALTTTFTGNLTGSVDSVTGAVGSVTAGVTLANGAITDASLAGNMEIVFETDFATNYNATRNAWVTNTQDFVGTTAADPFNGQVVAASVTAGVTLANGAITDASLAGNMEIVFETDFATNYNTTRNAWATNVQDFVGTAAADPFNGQVVAASVTAAVAVDDIQDGAIGAAAVADVFSTTTIAEAYTTDGSDGTPAQILYDILQSLTEFAIASTTLTVKQRDGSTTAATYTLDDDTSPTSRTRAT